MKRKRLQITTAENGWVIYEQDTDRQWVTYSPKELSELINKLAREQLERKDADVINS